MGFIKMFSFIQMTWEIVGDWLHQNYFNYCFHFSRKLGSLKKLSILFFDFGFVNLHWKDTSIQVDKTVGFWLNIISFIWNCFTLLCCFRSILSYIVSSFFPGNFVEMDHLVFLNFDMLLETYMMLRVTELDFFEKNVWSFIELINFYWIAL